MTKCRTSIDLRCIISHNYLSYSWLRLIFMPPSVHPPWAGGAGGIVFSCRPSVRAWCVRDIFVVYVEDFHQTFVNSTFSDVDDLISFGVKGQISRSQHDLQIWEKYHFQSLFPRYLWYVLMDFLQTFVISASWNIDELSIFRFKRSKVTSWSCNLNSILGVPSRRRHTELEAVGLRRVLTVSVYFYCIWDPWVIDCMVLFCLLSSDTASVHGLATNSSVFLMFVNSVRHFPHQTDTCWSDSLCDGSIANRKSHLKMELRLLGRLAVILLVAGSHCVNGFHSGAPDSVCSTMLPNHSGATAQNSPAPYQITTSSTTYTPGQSISGICYIILLIRVLTQA